jgi:4-azaleucine resistance transporter AzlC
MDREDLSTLRSGVSTRTRQEFFNGVRAVLPLLVGVSPFGMIYGVLARQAGIPANAAQAMSSILFAGSAQFIIAQLFSSATPVAVLILTIAVVNLRHALYSASIAPYVKHLRPAWKAVLSYLLTDEAYVVSILHYEDGADDGNKQWFFLGAGLGLWLIWQLSTAAGILLGAVIPPAWSLDFTLPLTFIAIVLPALKDRAAVVAALVAGVIAVLAFGLPYKLWLVVAALVGIGAGLLVEGRQ